MNKTLASVFQIATLIFSIPLCAAADKGSHEGLLLDSRIKYIESGSREVDSKVILNGDNWTLVTRTPQGNLLYGRTEKVRSFADGTCGRNQRKRHSSRRDHKIFGLR